MVGATYSFVKLLVEYPHCCRKIRRSGVSSGHGYRNARYFDSGARNSGAFDVHHRPPLGGDPDVAALRPDPVRPEKPVEIVTGNGAGRNATK